MVCKFGHVLPVKKLLMEACVSSAVACALEVVSNLVSLYSVFSVSVIYVRLDTIDSHTYQKHTFGIATSFMYMNAKHENACFDL